MKNSATIFVALSLLAIIVISLAIFWPESSSKPSDQLPAPNLPDDSKGNSFHSTATINPPETPSNNLDFAIAQAFDSARAKIIRNRQSHEAWGELGMVSLAHELYEEASLCFDQAVRLKPNMAIWHYCLAMALMDRNQTRALGHLEKSANLTNGSPTAPHLVLIEKLIEFDKLDLAQTHLNKFLQKQAKDGRALLAKGRLLYLRGDDRAAITALEQSLLHAPGRRHARLIMARAYLRLGNEAMSQKVQASADRIGLSHPWPDPFRERVLSHRTGLKHLLSSADLALNLRHTGKAIKFAKKATRGYPKSQDAWIKLGRAHLRLRNLRDAATAFDKAMAISPESPDAMFRKGIVHIHAREFKKGEQLYRKAIALKPDFTMAYLNLGLCMAGQNDIPGAIKALQDGILIDPDLFALRFRLADYLLRAKLPNKALVQFKEALKLNPQSQPTKDRIAQIKRMLAKPIP